MLHYKIYTFGTIALALLGVNVKIRLDFKRARLEETMEARESGGEITSEEATVTALQQLFTLFEQFHRHPELIAVAHDFLREMDHA